MPGVSASAIAELWEPQSLPSSAREPTLAAKGLEWNVGPDDREDCLEDAPRDRPTANGLAPFFWPASVRARHCLAAGTKASRGLTKESCVTLVRAGAFEDVSHLGRNRVAAGCILVRPTYGCRAILVGGEDAEIVELPWPVEMTLGAIYDGIDTDHLDAIARAGEGRATAMLQSIVARRAPRELVSERWADRLAAALRTDLHTGIADWARSHTMTPEAVARGFSRRHGVAPARFRLELRARAAWVRIVSSGDPLSSIALECGFYDQAHMTRSVSWLTGRRPSEWRGR